MYHYTIEDMKASACVVCCCEPLSLKPGSTTKVMLNYAPWSVPIGRLHCEPVFALEKKDTCGTTPGAPVKTGGDNVAFDTPMSTLLEDDLNTKVEDPETEALTFKALPLYGAKHGIVVINSDGTFTYNPTPGYNGPDHFYFTATDPTGNTATFEALIGVGSQSSADMSETPHVWIAGSSVNHQYHTASFAVAVSPAADLCEVWRLTVQMRALDCECICYDRTDCYDIQMVKC